MFSPDKDFEYLDKTIDKTENVLDKILLIQYRNSLKEIKVILADLYERYTVDGVLSWEELNRARRYESLIEQVNKEIKKIADLKVELITYGLTEIFNLEYLGSAEVIESVVGDIGLSVLNPLLVEEAIKHDFSGITFDERLDKHSDELRFFIKQDITQGIILGKSYKELRENIQRRLEGDVNKASKIVRTESNRLRNQARLEQFQNAEDKGIEILKEWRSSHDDRTRKNHRKLDGQRVRVGERFKVGSLEVEAPGKFGRASEDINCRCRVRSVFPNRTPERKADWKEIDKKAEELKQKNRTILKEHEEKESGLTKTEKMRKELEKQRAKTEKARKELEEARKRRDEKKEEAKALKGELRGKINKIQSDIDSVKRKIESIKTRILSMPEGKLKEDLKKELKDLRKELSAYRKKLKKLKQN